MAHEVEPKIWKAAVAATKRYFKSWRVRGTQAEAHTIVAEGYYRTGYIMGYRAGQRSARSGEVK
jgi:hypothetical protein